jgi:hypothetical protein
MEYGIFIFLVLTKNNHFRVRMQIFHNKLKVFGQLHFQDYGTPYK